MARPVKTPLSPDQRVEIAKVAEALFAERGFDGASIRDIAQQVGSTKALVYHYYHSKEKLYLSLLEAAVSEVVTKVEEVAAGKDEPEEKVRQVVRVFLDFYHAHPQRFHMVQRAIDEHGVAAATSAERWFSRVHLALHTIAVEGRRRGQFKRQPPQMVPFVVMGLIIHALRSHHLQERVHANFAGTYPLDGLAELILALLQAEAVGKKSRELTVGRRQRAGRRRAPRRLLAGS
jgi:AcrR family transcriptional regulator